MSIIYKFKITSSVLPTTLTYHFSCRCAILQSELFPSFYPSLVNSASVTDLNLINLYLQFTKLHSKVASPVYRRLDIQKIFVNPLKTGQPQKFNLSFFLLLASLKNNTKPMNDMRLVKLVKLKQKILSNEVFINDTFFEIVSNKIICD